LFIIADKHGLGLPLDLLYTRVASAIGAIFIDSSKDAATLPISEERLANATSSSRQQRKPPLSNFNLDGSVPKNMDKGYQSCGKHERFTRHGDFAVFCTHFEVQMPG
jgi:hypothetical protein